MRRKQRRFRQYPLRILARRLGPSGMLKRAERIAWRRDSNPMAFARFVLKGRQMEMFHAECKSLIAELPLIPMEQRAPEVNPENWSGE